MIQVLLVDDHQIVIDGIRMMLSSEADIACSGSANDGQAAMEQLANKAVDVVLLDINMPGTDGVETCKNIRKTYPNIKILVLSMLGETSVIRLMLKNGANGYLLKNAGKEEVVKAIRTLYAGERFFGTGVADIVLSNLAGDSAKATPHPFPQLTRREKQILRLIADEFTTGEIADKLGITFGTVETHRRSLLLKLGARNSAGLVRTAMQYDLLE